MFVTIGAKRVIVFGVVIFVQGSMSLSCQGTYSVDRLFGIHVEALFEKGTQAF